MRIHYLIGILVLAAMNGTSSPLTAADRFYLVVFASQTEGAEAQLAHTFATFVKTTDRDPAHAKTQTISWLPQSLDIVVLRRFPEPGKNFSLAATVDWAKTLKAQVLYWGPYAIKKDLHDLAVQQVKKLTSGKIAYKVLDLRYRPDVATNCIHALADVDTQESLLATGTAFGQEASSLVVQHFRKWFLEPNKVHPEIMSLLSFNQSGISLRSMDGVQKLPPEQGRAIPAASAFGRNALLRANRH